MLSSMGADKPEEPQEYLHIHADEYLGKVVGLQ
jgi:hypothetical protein